jgi:hypothetical protein
VSPEPFQISYEFLYAINNDRPYRHYLHIDNLEFCKILKGASSTPFMVRAVGWFQQISKNFPFICNSTGLLHFHNLTFNSNPMMVAYPAGYHRSILRFYDKNDFNIFNVSMTGVLSK